MEMVLIVNQPICHCIIHDILKSVDNISSSQDPPWGHVKGYGVLPVSPGGHVKGYGVLPVSPGQIVPLSVITFTQ